MQYLEICPSRSEKGYYAFFIPDYFNLNELIGMECSKIHSYIRGLKDVIETTPSSFKEDAVKLNLKEFKRYYIKYKWLGDLEIVSDPIIFNKFHSVETINIDAENIKKQQSRFENIITRYRRFDCFYDNKDWGLRFPKSAILDMLCQREGLDAKFFNCYSLRNSEHIYEVSCKYTDVTLRINQAIAWDLMKDYKI